MTPRLETSLDPVSGVVLVRASLATGRDDVWAALTTDALGVWLGRPEGLPHRMGARFALTRAAATSVHQVMRWRPRRLLGWSWQLPGEDDSSLTFRLSAVAPSSTVLTVEHRGLADVVGYGAGWQRHLDRLSAHLNGEPRDPAT